MKTGTEVIQFLIDLLDEIGIDYMLVDSLSLKDNLLITLSYGKRECR